MSRYFENEVRENVQACERPDFDRMWSRIEREVAERKAGVVPTEAAPRSRKKYIPAAIVFSCFMVAAVPAFAGVTLNWDHLYGGKSVTRALDNGIGQRYDLDASSNGVTMSLKGVVTDGERMKLLVAVDAGMKPEEYDVVVLEHMAIKDKAGHEEPLSGYLQYDGASGKLLGIYETKDTLKDGKKTYTLEAGNLVYYKSEAVPLKQKPAVGTEIKTGETRYPSLNIKSVVGSSEGLSVRYNVNAAEAKDGGSGDPHLTVTYGGQTVRGSVTQLPPEGEGIPMEQVFPRMAAKDWENADIRFNYLKESKRIEGSWSFHFQTDGKKAGEAIYSRPLQTSGEFREKARKSLDRLTVTPLEIIAGINEETPQERGKWFEVNYDDVRLQIGDQEIKGSYTIKGDDPAKYRKAYAFESPEWYKDWSGVPMKLILKQAVVMKRDTSANWLALHRPTAEKQTAEMNLESSQVRFTYYMDGKDLVVESEPVSGPVKGIGQSMLRVDGEDVYPEYAPRGPGALGKNIERYPDFNMSHTLEINPGIYRYSDPGRDVEMALTQK
ncbi:MULTISPECIES: DUF4179 domain-containing protein [Paenibacillus]|uniref:DUF4179 domain-containing protein n=1 Tax=Paenibacillus albilobatus TaxID=2716884 RepID=A0A919XNP4_9BACL|nr:MULTISPECIES: DUF4179 domain-containing protein [Paenibacillus]GIO34140.1 hypothetical protein J2TS6_52810 [Paenibacillus albilobatus]